MIGALNRHEADLSFTAMSITAHRRQAVDFLSSLFLDRITLVTYQESPEVSLNILVYLEIFTPKAFGGCGFIILLVAISASLIPFLNLDSLHKQGDSERFTFIHGVVLICLLLLQRDYPISAVRLPTKIMFLSACAFAFVTFTLYTALLTSNMIVQFKNPSFPTLQDFLKTEYPLGYWENTYGHELFKTAQPGSTLDRLNKQMAAEDRLVVYPTAAAGVEFLQTVPNAFAFDFILTFMNQPNIVVIQDFQDYHNLHYAPTMPQNSELIPLFKYHLLKLEQSGINYRLNKKYGLLSSPAESQINENTTMVLGYDNLAFLFIILGVGVLVSLVLGVAEAVFKRLL